MGQRLVVSVKSMGECLAKIYYHWSAYTGSALYETQKIVDCIYDHNNETTKQLQLRLIKFCEENGGGVRGDADEFKYIHQQYPNYIFKTDNYSRNNGLIAISERGMQALQYWSEGDVIINIDDDTINFDVCGWYENIFEYNDARREWDDEFESLTLDEVPDIGYDLCNFSVDDIYAVSSAIDAVGGNVVRYGNNIFELIE